MHFSNTAAEVSTPDDLLSELADGGLRGAEPLLVNDVVKQAISLCRPRLMEPKGPRIDLVEELGEPPRVLVHGAEFLSAVLNLLVNALDAMEHTADPTLAT